MSYGDLFLLLNFTALCAILVVLWQIRDHLLEGKAKLPASEKRESK
jgi:hypothetical protein